MNVLVTGGAGFIGTNLIKKLLNEGHEVTSFDNYELGKEENHVEGARYLNVRLDRYPINFEDKFDKIFHLAALSRIQPTFNDPLRTFEVNAHGTAKVLEQARLRWSKVIYAGSSSRWHDPYQSPYAAAKYVGEEICKTYKRVYGMDVEIARFYNVYGPHEVTEGPWAPVTGIWRKQVELGKPLTIVGDGEQRRDFTHVDDIVEGLYRIGFRTEIHEDAWELGSGTNYSINEMFAMFKKRFPDIEAQYIEDEPGNYRETLRTNNDALERLNWQPSDKLEQYILNL